MYIFTDNRIASCLSLEYQKKLLYLQRLGNMDSSCSF